MRYVAAIFSPFDWRNIDFVLFQVGVVNFIFSPVEEKLGKPLSKFSDAELSKFSALRGSITEFSLKKAVDPDGKRYPNKTYPWNQCIVEEECYKRLLDSQDHVNIVVGLEVSCVYFFTSSFKN